MSAKTIKTFQKKILGWYEKNKRDLPWRHTRDPYNILVSEIMSQQTQISRVVPKYSEWMKAFPTVESLAKANTRDVLLHWSGLGYNRRALYLKRFAETIVNHFGGVIPSTENELIALPGIGKYTARALLCFACNQQVAVVDTNVRKVILTQFTMINDQLTNKDIEEIAELLLPKGKAYEWNQALMDYAAAKLKAHKIPIPKQSRFKDSDRYYRGLALRLLLKTNNQSFEELWEKMHEITKERYQKILEKMVKDKLIEKRENIFYLQR